MLNNNTTMCSEEFILLNGSCVVMEPVKISGKHCLLQGKPFIVISLCVSSRIEIFLYKKYIGIIIMKYVLWLLNKNLSLIFIAVNFAICLAVLKLLILASWIL